MASTTHVSGGARGRGADSSMHQFVQLVSICPNCNHQRPQGEYSGANLGRLLDGGYPIEAYCVACDEFWAISPRERAAVAAELWSGK